MINKNNQSQNGDEQSHSVNATATIPRMTMPRLIDNLQNVKIYFISLDFWFEASSVTSDNKKYCSVMAQIPLNDLCTIQTELDTVPTEGKYDYIKPIIIAFYSDSQQKRFREAINDVQLGDSKPSKLYQKLKSLASDSLTDTALIDLWAARLPEMAHAAVIQMKDSPIKDRLVAADALVESIRLRNIGDRSMCQTNLQPLVAATKTNTIQKEATEINLLEKLSNQIAELERRFNNDRSRSKSSNSSKSRARSKSSTNHPNCWYHWKFGANAKRCKEPCNFNAKIGGAPSN